MTLRNRGTVEPRFFLFIGGLLGPEVTHARDVRNAAGPGNIRYNTFATGDRYKSA